MELCSSYRSIEQGRYSINNYQLLEKLCNIGDGQKKLATSIATLVSYIDSSTREKRQYGQDEEKEIYVTINTCQHYVIFLFCISSHR